MQFWKNSSQVIEGISSPASESSISPSNEESRCTWASPLPRAATQTWPERSSGSFHSRQLIHFPAETESTPVSQDHQKLLPKGWSKLKDPKKSHDWRISWNSPVPERAGQTEGDRVVQSVITKVFNRGTSTYFFLQYLNIYFIDISNINNYFCLRKIVSWQNSAIAQKYLNGLWNPNNSIDL